MRTFRVNRVRSVEVTNDPVERPDGFDLAEAWRSVVEHVEERRSEAQTGATAVIRTERWAVRLLQPAFPNAVTVLGPADVPADVGVGVDGGKVDVEVAARSPQWIAERLAAWGDHVEVLGPPEVRAHLAAIGRALLERYGED